MSDDGSSSESKGSDKSFQGKVAPEKVEHNKDDDNKQIEVEIEKSDDAAVHRPGAQQKTSSVQFAESLDCEYDGVERVNSDGVDRANSWGKTNSNHSVSSFAQRTLSTKNALRMRSSLEPGMFNHFKVIFLMQGLLVVSVAIVCVFSAMRYTYYCPQFDIPHPVWYCAWELTLIACGAGFTLLNMVHSACARDILPTRKVFLFCLLAWILSSWFFGAAAFYLKRPNMVMMARLAATGVFGAAWFYAMWSRIILRQMRRDTRRRLEKEGKLQPRFLEDGTPDMFEDTEDYEVPQPVVPWKTWTMKTDAERDRNLFKTEVLYVVVFFAGWFIAMLFVDFFKSSQNMARSTFTNDTVLFGTFTIGKLMISFTEMFLASAFFSLFLPKWSQAVAIHGENCSKFFFSHGVNEVSLERNHLQINFSLDLIRFVYGRGVLFRLSNFGIFFFFLFKDFCYQWWHFGFKYSEDYIVFVLKAFHPSPQGLPPTWVTIAKYTEKWVKCMGIARKLAVHWRTTIDYNDHLAPGAQPCGKTNVSIALTFANMNIKIVNLPHAIGKILKQAEKKGNAAATQSEEEMNAATRRQSLSFNAAQNGAMPVGKESSMEFQVGKENSNGLMIGKEVSEQEDGQEAVGKENSMEFTSGYNDRMSIRTSRTVKELKKWSSGVMPLDFEAQEQLQGVAGIMQSAIFNRYQTRAMAKFFTSYMFLSVPIVTSYTNAKNSPGFTSPLDYAVDADANTLFIAGIAFLINDVVEWVCITFGILYRRTRDIHSKIDVYRQLLTKKRSMIYVHVCWGSILGIFMYNRMWDPWNEKKLAEHLVTKRWPEAVLQGVMDGPELACGANAINCANPPPFGSPTHTALVDKIKAGTQTLKLDWKAIFEECGY